MPDSHMYQPSSFHTLAGLNQGGMYDAKHSKAKACKSGFVQELQGLGVAPVGVVLQRVHNLHKAQAFQDLGLDSVMSEIV